MFYISLPLLSPEREQTDEFMLAKHSRTTQPAQHKLTSKRRRLNPKKSWPGRFSDQYIQEAGLARKTDPSPQFSLGSGPY